MDALSQLLVQCPHLLCFFSSSYQFDLRTMYSHWHYASSAFKLSTQIHNAFTLATRSRITRSRVHRVHACITFTIALPSCFHARNVPTLATRLCSQPFHASITFNASIALTLATRPTLATHLQVFTIETHSSLRHVPP